MNDSMASYGGETPPPESHYVYILKCCDDTLYVGCTKNLENRMKKHSNGLVSYTRSRLPFQLIVSTYFPDRYKAYAFEKYLKSGSGRAFTKRHYL